MQAIKAVLDRFYATAHTRGYRVRQVHVTSPIHMAHVF